MRRLRAAAAAALLFAPWALAGARAAWQDLSSERREAVLANWRRYRAMPPATQALLRVRYAAYRSLPPEERARVQRRYAWLRTLSRERLTELRAGLTKAAPSRRPTHAAPPREKGTRAGDRERTRAREVRGRGPGRERARPPAAHGGGRR